MNYKEEIEQSYRDEADRILLGEMYELLTIFSPTDTGPAITHRVRKGRKYRVGRTRLYVPTRNDAYEAAYSGGGHLHGAGYSFVDRYVRVSETYIDCRGQRINGTELLEKHGVIVGKDVSEAIEDFLRSAIRVDAISHDTCLRLADRYGVSRGTVANIIGSCAKVHVVRHKESKKRGLVVKIVD